jgi:hypothetical protein
MKCFSHTIASENEEATELCKEEWRIDIDKPISSITCWDVPNKCVNLQTRWPAKLYWINLHAERTQKETPILIKIWMVESEFHNMMSFTTHNIIKDQTNVNSRVHNAQNESEMSHNERHHERTRKWRWIWSSSSINQIHSLKGVVTNERTVGPIDAQASAMWTRNQRSKSRILISSRQHRKSRRKVANHIRNQNACKNGIRHHARQRSTLNQTHHTTECIRIVDDEICTNQIALKSSSNEPNQ